MLLRRTYQQVEVRRLQGRYKYISPRPPGALRGQPQPGHSRAICEEIERVLRNMDNMVWFNSQVLHYHPEGVVLCPRLRQSNRVYIDGDHRAAKKVAELLAPLESINLVP